MNILDLILKEVAKRGSDLKDSISKLQESLNAILKVLPEEERAAVIDAVLKEIRTGLAGQAEPSRKKKGRRGRPRKTKAEKKNEAGIEAEGTIEAEIPEKKKRKKRRKKRKVSAKQAQYH